MNFPSSNTDSANAALNDVVSNVGSSHGVRLTGGSTGGIVEPVGDDANITLRVRGKGTGGVVLGNSSQGVTVGSGNSALLAVNKYTVQFTAPALSSGVATASVASTYTVAGLSTGTVLLFTPTNPIGAGYKLTPRCSTANELTIGWGLAAAGASTIGTGESTNRGVLVEFKF